MVPASDKLWRQLFSSRAKTDKPLQVQTDILEKERNSSDMVSDLAEFPRQFYLHFLQAMECTLMRTDSFVTKDNGNMDTNMVLLQLT